MRLRCRVGGMAGRIRESGVGWRRGQSAGSAWRQGGQRRVAAHGRRASAEGCAGQRDDQGSPGHARGRHVCRCDGAALNVGASGVQLPGHPATVVAQGRLFAARAGARSVRLKAGRTATVRFQYVAPAAARSLHATGVTASQAFLAWSAPRAAKVILRRTTGAKPAAGPGLGKAVRTKGPAAIDAGLSPGAQYTYALFTRVRGRWSGPLTLTLTTAPPAGSATSVYIASPVP